MENITKQLHEGNFSCVINNQGVIRAFTQRGVGGSPVAAMAILTGPVDVLMFSTLIFR